jgi:lipoprotein-anchoring transpeptidase ErfK/SrfK
LAVKRNADLASGAKKGGATNPTRPQALDLYRNGCDLPYRSRGTPEPGTIGAGASSGRIRLFPED